jgi:hypothetical protein
MKKLAATAGAVLLGISALAAPALAGPGGGHGAGMGGGMGGGVGGGFGSSMGSAQMSSGIAVTRPTTPSGGMSSGNMSTEGAANTNGPSAMDRDTGLDRAEDRANAEGLDHGKALQSQATDNDADDENTTSTSTSARANAKTRSGSISGSASTNSSVTH